MAGVVHTHRVNRLRDGLIQRDGLTLRPFTDLDVESIAVACNDAEIQQWLPHPSPYTEELASWFVCERAPTILRSGTGIVRGIEVDGRLMGVIDLKHANWHARSVEIGYWVAPWGRGRGLAACAIRALTDWAHAQGMRRVEIRVAPDNLASLLSAQRAGFTEEGTLRQAGYIHAGPVDLVVLSHLPYD